MGVFDRWKNLLGGSRPRDATPVAETSSSDDAHEAELAKTFAARDRFWAKVGAVESDVLGHLISPSFTGGPAWPTTRQAYRVVRRGASILLATDGMADPFDGAAGAAPVNGFQIELFLETSDIPKPFAGRPGEIGELKNSWAFAVLQSAAEVVANSGGVAGMLDRYGVISTEFPGVRQSGPAAAQLPDRFVTADDALGVLIGRPEPDFASRIDDTPLSPVRIVPVVLVTAAELEHLRAGGAAARTALADKLAASPSRHLSDLKRPSVV